THTHTHTHTPYTHRRTRSVPPREERIERRTRKLTTKFSSSLSSCSTRCSSAMDIQRLLVFQWWNSGELKYSSLLAGAIERFSTPNSAPSFTSSPPEV